MPYCDRDRREVDVRVTQFESRARRISSAIDVSIRSSSKSIMRRFFAMSASMRAVSASRKSAIARCCVGGRQSEARAAARCPACRSSAMRRPSGEPMSTRPPTREVAGSHVATARIEHGRRPSKPWLVGHSTTDGWRDDPIERRVATISDVPPVRSGCPIGRPSCRSSSSGRSMHDSRDPSAAADVDASVSRLGIVVLQCLVDADRAARRCDRRRGSTPSGSRRAVTPSPRRAAPGSRPRAP